MNAVVVRLARAFIGVLIIGIQVLYYHLDQ